MRNPYEALKAAAIDHDVVTDMEEALFQELLNHVEVFSSMEASFGPSKALARFGRKLLSKRERPDWLVLGVKRACYDNATSYAVTRDDVWYTEGFAVGPDLPLPVEHAWLIDASGRVIDPTWEDTDNNAYFGIPFRRSFVTEMLAQNKGQAGILVNLYLLRRHLRSDAALEAAIAHGRTEM